MANDSLERETRVAGVAKTTPAAPSAWASLPVERESALDQSILDVVQSDDIKGLIRRIMDGSEPLPRPLTHYEPRCFNPRNVNIILMKAAGFQGTEVAETIGCTREHVSVIYRHPYGQKLFHALLPEALRTSLDARSRLKQAASLMLERLIGIGLSTPDEQVATRIGFGILDRAGYNAVTKVDQRTRVDVMITDSAAAKLERALAQSRIVDQIVTADFQVLAPPAGGAVGTPANSPSVAIPVASQQVEHG